MKIDPSSSLPLTGPELQKSAGVPNKGGFADLLADAVGKVNTGQEEAGSMVKRFASGEEVELHEVLIAVERADLSFRTMMQVRNRLIDAYREIMRMSI